MKKILLVFIVSLAVGRVVHAGILGATPLSTDLRLMVEKEFPLGKKWPAADLTSAINQVLDKMYDVNEDLQNADRTAVTEESLYNVLFVLARVGAVNPTSGDFAIYAHGFCDFANFQAAFNRLSSEAKEFLKLRLLSIDAQAQTPKCAFLHRSAK